MNSCPYLICQYRDKPKAVDTVKSIYRETKNTFESVIDLAEVLNIDFASGYALDLVGRHVGVSRILPKSILKSYFGFFQQQNALAFGEGTFYRYKDSLLDSVVLNDEDYRFFIKARISKNYQNGEISNIIRSIQFVIGQNSNVIDLQNMSMNIIVNNEFLNSLTLYAISQMDILIRPIGVMYRFLVLTNNQPYGFAGDSSAYAFNVGKFVRLQEIGITQ